MNVFITIFINKYQNFIGLQRHPKNLIIFQQIPFQSNFASVHVFLLLFYNTIGENITTSSPFYASADVEFAQGNDDHLAMGKFATLFRESSFFPQFCCFSI